METDPGSLFGLAAGTAALGILLIWLCIKVTGDDIYRQARDSERYRNMGLPEQMSNFYSDPRNIPIAGCFAGGMLLVIGCGIAIGAIVQLLTNL
jgi:hypothetical protein